MSPFLTRCEAGRKRGRGYAPWERSGRRERRGGGGREGTIASVRKTPSMEMFSIVRWGDCPLWRMTSFIA